MSTWPTGAAYAPHSIAESISLMPEDQLASLADDILVNRQLHPIVLYEGKILDGRNRYLACLRAGVEPVFVVYDGLEPEQHANALNYERRDLNDGTRGLGRTRLVELKRKRLKLAKGIRHDRVQRSLPVDNTDAAYVVEHGIPDLVAALKAGDVSASKAREIAELEHDEQQHVLSKANEPPSTRANVEHAEVLYSERIELMPMKVFALREALKKLTVLKYSNQGVIDVAIAALKETYPWL